VKASAAIAHTTLQQLSKDCEGLQPEELLNEEAKNQCGRTLVSMVALRKLSGDVTSQLSDAKTNGEAVAAFKQVVTEIERVQQQAASIEEVLTKSKESTPDISWFQNSAEQLANNCIQLARSSTTGEHVAFPMKFAQSLPNKLAAELAKQAGQQVLSEDHYDITVILPGEHPTIATAMCYCLHHTSTVGLHEWRELHNAMRQWPGLASLAYMKERQLEYTKNENLLKKNRSRGRAMATIEKKQSKLAAEAATGSDTIQQPETSSPPSNEGELRAQLAKSEKEKAALQKQVEAKDRGGQRPNANANAKPDANDKGKGKGKGKGDKGKSKDKREREKANAPAAAEEEEKGWSKNGRGGSRGRDGINRGNGIGK
jgi:hypothetical protein